MDLDMMELNQEAHYRQPCEDNNYEGDWVCAEAKDNYIGQGTYSSVFRARDLETGKIVALKVRFDNFEPESVRFMAREIIILRRLDHPNIIKLEGLITSRSSCSIYLVFEYMEHDLSGLLACPDIKFGDLQIKCYMKQLLSGLEHCHSQGVMHRDIKGSNLLINNEGILKVADFGLANFSTFGYRQPLTSRVVTLWYRPPELLLGSTDYGPSVVLWSVGCVFAEVLHGNPILQGRTEVEQLHKIFKLCGSPLDEYWKKSKLPHARFKPQQPYESCLQETFRDLPTPAVNLIETFLSVEPYKCRTATSALASEVLEFMILEQNKKKKLDEIGVGYQGHMFEYVLLNIFGVANFHLALLFWDNMNFICLNIFWRMLILFT